MKKNSMLSVGTPVKIVYSRRLQEYQLLNLVGQAGVVTEVVTDRKTNKGAHVLITKGVNKDEEWFIPIYSIQSRETINRIRSEMILKQF